MMIPTIEGRLIGDGIEPTGEIHAAAAIFPMLPEDELAELAADIKANGLIHPIVIDADGALIDGRNRMAACRMAGVEPRFTSLNGRDPITYILSANINRRNLTAGQRAMAAAKLFLENNRNQTQAGSLSGVSQSRIAKANIVLKHAPELADAVLAGTEQLNPAYEYARQRKEEQASRADRQRGMEYDLAAMRRNASDLADLVDEERMALREALTIWEQRKQEDREQKQRTSKTFLDTITMLDAVLLNDPDRVVLRWYDGTRKAARRGQDIDALVTSDGLRDLSARLTQVADTLDEHGGRLS